MEFIWFLALVGLAIWLVLRHKKKVAARREAERLAERERAAAARARIEALQREQRERDAKAAHPAGRLFSGLKPTPSRVTSVTRSGVTRSTLSGRSSSSGHRSSSSSRSSYDDNSGLLTGLAVASIFSSSSDSGSSSSYSSDSGSSYSDSGSSSGGGWE